MSNEGTPIDQEVGPEDGEKVEAQIIMPDQTTETITAKSKKELMEKIKDLRDSTNER